MGGPDAEEARLMPRRAHRRRKAKLIANMGIDEAKPNPGGPAMLRAGIAGVSKEKLNGTIPFFRSTSDPW